MGDLWDLLYSADYTLGRAALQRGMALVYLVAFLNVRNQFRPLLGAGGLLPSPDFLAGRGFKDSPSLFHWRYSDRMAAGVAWVGMTLSAGILLGGLEVVPLTAGIGWWLVLWALYLSVVNVGQIFYGFGWESLLLEAGFLVAFLGNGTVEVPWPVLLALRWLLFRVEFGAGMIKIRGDRCWRDLTCLDYHHETQPLPGPTSRWFHRLPPLLHRVEVAANHIAQLVVPFLLFAPQPVSGAAALTVIVTQGYLMISGNYAWLNLATLLLAFSGIPDAWFDVIGMVGGESARAPAWLAVVAVGLAAGVAWLSRHPVRNLLGRRQLMNYSFNRYHLVNTYGAFGSVTRRRRELILEATTDGVEWHPYEFKGKPGDPRRRPSQWAPYHLRLDWLMWFVPLSPSYGRDWLEALVEKLLAADPAVLSLLHRDPLSGDRPAAVRGRLVDYRFTTDEEKRRTTAWWATGESLLLFGPVRAEDTTL